MGLTPLVQVFLLKYHFWHFFLTQRKEEMWPGGTQPMLLPESSCTYIVSFRSVAPRVFLEKIPFLAFSHCHDNHFSKFEPLF